MTEEIFGIERDAGKARIIHRFDARVRIVFSY